MAIRSFKSRIVERFFLTRIIDHSVGWHGIAKVVLRKLDMMHYATKLIDLKSPPSNHLEKLKGDLNECYSIRVNKQWRIVFRWEGERPSDIDVTDYH